MSARTCPDWPSLMEVDPDLQFKHYTVSEAQLPAESLSRVSHVSLTRSRSAATSITTSSTAGHTDPEIAEALSDTHWFDLDDWSTSGPGAQNGAPHAA